jgi:hypothetical protein
VAVGDHSVRSVAVRPDRPTTIVAGDAVGTIVALDLRTGLRTGGYKVRGGGEFKVGLVVVSFFQLT